MDDSPAVAAYAAAAAALLGFSLDAERTAATATTLARIAGFAADLAAVPLDDATEIACVFTP